MLVGKKKMKGYFTAAFAAVFLFLSTFANCLHAYHHKECAAGKSAYSTGNQTTGIIVTSGEHKDCEGDCAACSYLISAQGAYFDTVNLPGKQVSSQYSVTEPKLFHIEICIEYPPRAPPYFPL